MNCFNHPNESAVSQCKECGKGLCLECTNQFSKPICPACFSASRKKQKRAALKEILLTLLIGCPIGFILAVLVYDIVTPDDNWWKNSFFMMFMGLGIVSGWKTLNKVTPQAFLFLPILGWGIYFIMKAGLAILVGLVAFPVRMIRNLGVLFK